MPRVKRTTKETTVEQLPDNAEQVASGEGEAAAEPLPPRTAEGKNPFELMDSISDNDWRAQEWSVYVYQISPAITNRSAGKPAYLERSFDKVTPAHIKQMYAQTPGDYLFEIWVKRGSDTVCRGLLPLKTTQAEVARPAAGTGDAGLIEKLFDRLDAARRGEITPTKAIEQSMEMMGTAYRTSLETVAGGNKDPLAIVKTVMELVDKNKGSEAAIMTKLIDRAFGEGAGKGKSDLESMLLERLIDRALPDSPPAAANPADPMAQLNNTIEVFDKMKERFGGGVEGGGGRASGWGALFQAIAPHAGGLIQAALMMAQAYLMKSRAEAAMAGRGYLPPGAPGSPPQWAPAPGAAAAPQQPQPGSGVAGVTDLPALALDPVTGAPIPGAGAGADARTAGQQPEFTPFPAFDPAALQGQLQQLFIMIARMYENGREGEFVAAVLQEMAAPGGPVAPAAALILEQVRGCADAEELARQVAATPVIGVLAQDPEFPRFARSMLDYFKRDEIEQHGQGAEGQDKAPN